MKTLAKITCIVTLGALVAGGVLGADDDPKPSSRYRSNDVQHFSVGRKSGRTAANGSNAALGDLLFKDVVSVYFVGPGHPANPDGSLGALVLGDFVEMKIYERYIVREYTDPLGVTFREVHAYEKLGRIEQRFAAATVKGARAGEERVFEIAPGVSMVFCWVPAGTATLGSPTTEAHRTEDEQEHEFTTSGFWMGKYEVTQQEWVAVMGENPSYFQADGRGSERIEGIKDTSRFPVEGVSWNNCQQFLKRLNARPGVKAAFGQPVTFKLPHEDEWEYACRGGKGNKQPFHFGTVLNGQQANCDGSEYPYGTNVNGPFLDRTTAVGSYAKEYPHPWNFCDMHGNVHEQCENENGSNRAVRGGAWGFNGVNCRAADRAFIPPDASYPDGNQGFRVVGVVGGEVGSPPPAAAAPTPRDDGDTTAKRQIALWREGYPRVIYYKDKAGPPHIVGRLTVNDHAIKQDCRVFSVGVEIDNLTARQADVQIDPKDLKLELLDVKGNIIEESPIFGSGPVPISHKATIPTSGYVGISSYRGGIGLMPESILLAAGEQAWVLKPGVYRVRGTLTGSLAFGEDVLDPEKSDEPDSNRLRTPQAFKLDLIDCQFELKEEANAPIR